MEEYQFLFSKSRLSVHFLPQTSVSVNQIASVKEALLKSLPQEQGVSQQEVARIRLFSSGRELDDKETLQRVQVPPGLPRHLHVQLSKVQQSSAPRDLDDSGLAKHSGRLCCSECVLW
jgi:hypothetical protein